MNKIKKISFFVDLELYEKIKQKKGDRTWEQFMEAVSNA